VSERYRRAIAIAMIVVLVLGVLMLAAAPLLGAVPVASAAPAAPAAPGAAPLGPVEPWSQVTGTDGREWIADQQGRALQFRGVNVKADEPADVATDDLMADLEARGFDLLRLAVYWDRFEPTDDAWDEGYLAQVATVLDRAEAHHVRVVLDMHQDNFNQKFGGAGMPDWVTDDEGLPFEPQPVWFLNALQPALMESWENLYERPAFRAAQVDAWEELVTRFHGHASILGYDLLNEPFGKIRAGEDFVKAIERVESTQLTPMYQRLTTAIRAIDPQRWVFIEAPNQASLGIRSWLGGITGGRIAFFPHVYDSSIESATYTPGGTVTGFDPKFHDTYSGVIDVYPDAHHVPVLFGEWGVAHPEAPGMAEYVRRTLGLMEDHGSGWAQFSGCRGSGYCAFGPNGEDRPGIGQITQPWATAIAGAPTSTHYDGAAKQLLVVFSDSDATGATDIVIPSTRVYPDGWVVEVSDADGTWSSTTSGGGTDADPEVLSVTTARTGGPHAICVKPAGAPKGCQVPVDPPPPTPTTVPGDGVAPASGARPVPGTSRFTG
jgi:endoglycosylceramidase